jgi:stage II sporulation protein D
MRAARPVARFALFLTLSLPLAAGPTVLKIQIRTPQGSRIVEVPLEKYVAATLAGESSLLRSDEATKAMAVAARTYALRLRGRHAAQGFDLCSSTHCQRIDLSAATPRLEAQATSTSGELLWYKGKLAFTPYSRDCGGHTETAEAVWGGTDAPYLKVHDDPYCLRAGNPDWKWTADPARIAAALKHSGLSTPAVLERIEIARRSPSGRALTLLLEGSGEAVRITASTFRFAMGREIAWNTVQSDHYNVASVGGRVAFDGRGSGHGVGLCQRGADQMGVEGKNYRDILAFYFPGAELGANARGLAWQRLSAESLVLFTTRPSQDSAVLAAAQRELHAALDRTHIAPPAAIELRVYPDVETFRNATGEPGWVAAYTVGSHIQLQPVATLRARNTLDQTLRHELLHVLVESKARPGTPLWFREGLVEYLAGASPIAAAAPKPPSDEGLQQTADPARARRAYEQAAQVVAARVNQYGETAVLGWLSRGVPP